MKNKYNVHHKRQTLANFQKDIHEFHFDYNGDRIASCVGALTVIFDDEDDIPEDVQLEVQNKIYDMIDKYEKHWAVPEGAREKAAVKSAKKQKIMSVIAAKEDAALQDASIDDLQKMLDDLDD